VLAEYERAPAVTRERLYIETIEAVLASSKKVVIDTTGSGNLLYLPIDKLIEQGRRGRVETSDVSATIEHPASNSSSTAGDRRPRGSR
jgi:membrane protease subunit HflK